MEIYDIKQNLNQYFIKSLGWKKYSDLFKNKENNIREDESFQRTFNGYFLVRRNAEWRRNFYDVFESVKNQSPTFEEILRNISLGNNVEASFASKMLAIIDANNPIIDRYVLEYFNKKIEGESKEDRMKCAIQVYNDIKVSYVKLLKKSETIEALKQFNEQFPDCKDISDVKKLDFLIWLKGAIN